MTVTSVFTLRSSVETTRGVRSFQSIVKYGSTILSAAGRFSQIWKSSPVFGALRLTRGNISQCCTPWPAVIHWVSPCPKRAVAPIRVGVIDQALTDMGDGLEAAVGMLREPRHTVTVVHRPAVLLREVTADRSTLEC